MLLVLNEEQHPARPRGEDVVLMSTTTLRMMTMRQMQAQRKQQLHHHLKSGPAGVLYEGKLTETKVQMLQRHLRQFLNFQI